MKNIVATFVLFASLSVFSQEQRKTAILPGCENAEDPGLCLEQKLQKDITSFFSQSVKDTLITRVKKAFFVISVGFFSGKDGKVDSKWLSVSSLSRELDKKIKKYILDLPAFLPEVDENGYSFTTSHRLSLVYKIDSAKNEILIPAQSEIDEADFEIPFAVIEDVPVFPGCERVDKKQRRDCFQQKMQQHIMQHFRYPVRAQMKGIMGRVFVIFIIDKDGKVTDIRARGPHKLLEKEAVRIIKELPDMTPGKYKGAPVRVPFAIPITFKL
ncbi:MAG: energy transducer TonB [Sinomicrobium sp.]|nr:energy transducer TonB [Sinomicrobium sp.]